MIKTKGKRTKIKCKDRTELYEDIVLILACILEDSTMEERELMSAFDCAKTIVKIRNGEAVTLFDNFIK